MAPAVKSPGTRSRVSSGLFVVAITAVASCTHAPAAATAEQRLQVRFETDQPAAVLEVMDTIARGRAVPGAQWRALFATRGYRRLQERERGMGRQFEDSTFRSFATSPDVVARRAALRRTVDEWREIDVTAAAGRALAYLPPHAVIRATVYPVIKPQENSFVWDLATDPAIFLYVDPEVSADQLENTIAHELHHVGYAGACEDPVGLEPRAALAQRWLGAFGEGFAMLAAAGGPHVNAHHTSAADERAVWDAELAKLPEHFAALEAFFTDVLDGSITGDAVTQRAAGFYGVQGPWYSVGWFMAAEIEKARGRAALVDVICSPVELLELYNRVARERSGAPLWDNAMIQRMKTTEAGPATP